MTGVDFKTDKLAYEKGLEPDRQALAVIENLGLKDQQQISEDDLLTVIQALYPKDYQIKLDVLLNSKYLKALYVIDLH